MRIKKKKENRKKKEKKQNMFYSVKKFDILYLSMKIGDGNDI